MTRQAISNGHGSGRKIIGNGRFPLQITKWSLAVYLSFFAIVLTSVSTHPYPHQNTGKKDSFDNVRSPNDVIPPELENWDKIHRVLPIDEYSSSTFPFSVNSGNDGENPIVLAPTPEPGMGKSENSKEVENENESKLISSKESQTPLESSSSALKSISQQQHPRIPIAAPPPPQESDRKQSEILSLNPDGGFSLRFPSFSPEISEDSGRDRFSVGPLSILHEFQRHNFGI
jgi:hypothetical protein